ncbi:RNA polymerase factor sigma-54 [Sesbania bispinosa]|nr:RNA polymerase factor sigma-54 [Sesbania bispinosa]
MEEAGGEAVTDGGSSGAGESEEGDGRVGGGDALDVGVDGRVVEEAGGEEDCDRVTGLVTEDMLG